MVVIKVDRVDPEPLQRGVARGRDLVRRKAFEEADLGRDHDLAAIAGVALQPVTDHGLALAALWPGTQAE